MDRVPEGVSIRLSEVEEIRVIANFVLRGCGCNKKAGQACSSLFSADYFTSRRLCFKELTRAELDLVIFGQLFAFKNTSTTTSASSRNTPHTRRLSYISYMHQGKPIF